MPLSHIEHFLVSADDMDRTRDWYRDVLGMQEGPHPDFGFPVHWMYLDGRDVVHIGRGRIHAFAPSPGGESTLGLAIFSPALTNSDYHETVQ